MKPGFHPIGDNLVEPLALKLQELLTVCNPTTNCRIVVFAELPTKAFYSDKKFCQLDICHRVGSSHCDSDCLNSIYAHFNELLRLSLHGTCGIEYVDLTWNVIHRMNHTDLVHWSDEVRESNIQ